VGVGWCGVDGVAGDLVMEIKLFEIRDRATFIPAMAIKLRNRTPEEFYLLRRAGFSAEQIGWREEDFEPYIVLTRLVGGEANYDAFSWGNRTMQTAHLHMINYWSQLTSGDVIDVEFILSETTEMKKSERENEWKIS
jgi:hypothetical protein